MPVPMPSAVVLIVCKTMIAGPVDQNAAYTGYENRQWATEHSMMVCRRQEVQLFDQAEAMGAAAQPFNLQRCQRAGISLGVNGTPAIVMPDGQLQPGYLPADRLISALGLKKQQS